ncbi:MAG: hypothetical protein WA733_16740 [Methylocystis sp.]
MVYVFEFFVTDLDGSRLLLGSTKYRLKSKDLARGHAMSMMDNMLFKGKKATICALKDQTGSLIGEVHAARQNA